MEDTQIDERIERLQNINTGLQNHLDQAADLLKRIRVAYGKPHWKLGEAMDPVMVKISGWLSDRKLEREIEADM